MTPRTCKKLIEVALPLEEINAASKADKGRAHGTLKNLHKWFAPAPLPAWRALLFAALIDDPGDDNRRVYLLDLIKRLVANGADLPDSDTLEEARQVIRHQFPDGVPTVMDPFCGGGSTLVEAQRLGLPAYGSDLNPVPVLITRTLTELVPKVHGQQPLHPEPEETPKTRGKRNNTADPAALTLIPDSGRPKTYTGYDGLIRDVTYYAERIRDQAWEQLKDHYPSQPGETPIAWLWARTATCPNPTCSIETILTTSWWLSKKNGDLAWIQPQVRDGRIELDVITGQRQGQAPEPPKVGRGANFSCLACAQVLAEPDLELQARHGGLGLRVTAVVADRDGQRIYRSAEQSECAAASRVAVDDRDPIFVVPASDGGTRNRFGVDHQGDLYTPRQLLTLATFADLVAATHQQILDDGGTKDWADAVATMLGIGIGRVSQFSSSQARWTVRSEVSSFEGAFARNDLPMTWDFYEIHIFGDWGPAWMPSFKSILGSLRNVVSTGRGRTYLGDARSVREPMSLVATDPPYFDAIGYADLSDYFYAWHRRALRNVHPDLYGTVAAPKANELTAIPSHHSGSKEVARDYFIRGFTEAFRNLQVSMVPDLPMLVIYASKEQKSGQGEETRWESILTAMVNADLEITGAWPIHMTSSRRMVGQGANAVAAYIVLVCRPRPKDASTISLGDFVRSLRRELPGAIRDLQAGSILPVDLYQAALGPGMQIYSRYREVEDSHGERVPVGRALQLITAAVGEVLDEQEGDLDAASRFAVTWWDQFGWQPGPFGDADKVARQYGTHVDDVVRSGVVTSRAGKVQLLGAEQLDRSWTPQTDTKPTAWEAVHHLADRLIDGGGEIDAAALLAQLGSLQDSARALAYRLHDIAAHRGRAKDQERYNALIGRWTSMVALAATHTPEGLF